MSALVAAFETTYNSSIDDTFVATVCAAYPTAYNATFSATHLSTIGRAYDAAKLRSDDAAIETTFHHA